MNSAGKRFSPEGLCVEEFTGNGIYAEVLYKRAVGEAPEVETSKAMARILFERVRAGDRILVVPASIEFDDEGHPLSCSFENIHSRDISGALRFDLLPVRK